MKRNVVRYIVPPAVKAWLRSFGSPRGHIRPPGINESESFGVLVERRKEWLFATLPLAAAEYHYDIFLKTSQKRHARRLGLAIAKSFVEGVPLNTALAYVEDNRLERFVIKPNSSYDGIACRSLVREGNVFRDIRLNRRLKLHQLKRELQEEKIRGRPDSWLVEEMLLATDGSIRPVDEYNLYCFGGVAELILQKLPVKGTKTNLKRWYDREWQVVYVRAINRHDGVAFVPVYSQRLLAVAESASSRLCYPFIRIDLYDTSRGIVLGEFTPGPGQRYSFNAEWNARFVRRWREAEAALEEGIRSGRITPLQAEPGEDSQDRSTVVVTDAG